MNFPSNIAGNLKTLFILLLISAASLVAFDTTDIRIRYGVLSGTLLFILLHRLVVIAFQTAFNPQQKQVLCAIYPYLYLLHLDNALTDEDWYCYQKKTTVLAIFMTFFSVIFGIILVGGTGFLTVEFIRYTFC